MQALIKNTISRWSLIPLLTFVCFFVHLPVSAQSSIDLYSSENKFSNWEIYKSVTDIRGMETFGGSLWLATSGGLIQHDVESDTLQAIYKQNNSILTTSSITMLSTSGDSLMFVGTSKGLHFIKADGSYHSLTNDNSTFPISWIYNAGYDKNGTLWIAMSTGLVKIQQDNITRFYSSLNSPLTTDRVYDIEVESDGSVLVASTKLFRITTDDEWTNLNHPGDEDRIYNIELDSSGTIYTLSDDTGLQKYTDGNWSYITTNNSGLKSNSVRVFSIDENDHIWVGYYISNPPSQYTLISSFDGSDWVHRDVSRSLFKTSYFYPEAIHVMDGSVWAGMHNEGLFTLRNFSDTTSSWTKKHITREYLFPRNIRWMHVDNKDRVWINSERSLLMFDEEKWTSYDHLFRLSKSIYKIDSDRNGNIWFLSGSGSFGYFNPETEHVQIWNTENMEGLPVSTWHSVSGLSVDESGTAWITMGNVGLLRYNGTVWEIIEEEEDPYNYGYQSEMGTGFSGDVFVSKDDQLKRYQDGEWTQFYGVPGHWRFFTAITADKDGAAWVGGDHESYGLGPPGTGLAKVTETGYVVYDVGNTALPDRHIRSIHVDHNNHIWVATWDSGIAYFDREEWTAYTRSNSPIISTYVYSIDTQNDGDVWIATGSELYKIKDGIAVSTQEFEMPASPKTFTLHPNYPNPFNPSTTLRFDLDQTADVRIEVFSLLGERIAVLANQKYAPGSHEVTFNAEGLSSGIYFFRVSTPETVQTIKGILMK